jgi:hypothetical protein
MDLIVGMILAICEGDTRTYMIQEYHRSCKQYYVNCLVDKRIIDEQSLKECKDEAKIDK